MKNHTHSHSIAFEPAHPERYAAARKSTWVSIVINLLLTLLQVVAGYLGRSQSLMADGLHSLSDLFADIMVLFEAGNMVSDASGYCAWNPAVSLLAAGSDIVAEPLVPFWATSAAASRKPSRRVVNRSDRVNPSMKSQTR